MYRGLLSFMLDMVAPPRTTENIVRHLALEDLEALALHNQALGLLPYHDERVRALVWEVKYYANAQALAVCGTLLHEALLATAVETIGRPLLVPIPMHPKRRHERGHNQTELLCEAALTHMASRADMDYAPSALVRVRLSTPQQGLPEHRRRTNVRDTMRAPDASLIAGRVCIVLDDVTTTGATFAEATRALTDAGARDVLPLALAAS